MSATHTPGPWCISKESKTIIKQYMSYIGAEGVLIGSASGHPNSGFFPTDDESIANARLISAAPDLLEALAGLMEAIYFSGPDVNDRVCFAEDKARAAVAKATCGAA